MAKSREIKKRIQSVRNTRKITKTMEMVATAKSKRMVDKVNASKPYGEKIAELMDVLGALKEQVDSPYLRTVSDPRKVSILVVTANRGLCGGYNSNALRMARNLIVEYREQGREVEIHVIGKKGIAFFKFLKIKPAAQYDDIDDKLGYANAEKIASYFMKEFAEGRTDRVEVVSTVYHSSARQVPEVTRILPIGIEEATEKDKKSAGAPANVIYEPSPEIILKKLLPLVVKTMVYRALLEAVASEQIYRRIAMKNATDAAGEMIKLLTRTFNRVRQAAITQELSEIVAGADAIS